jgi:hypothetical protein
VRPQGRDWAPLIVLGVAGSIAICGACFLGGYTVGYMQHKPVVAAAGPTSEPVRTPFATNSAIPTPTPGVVQPTISPDPRQCAFGDFPVYPGSTRIGDPMANGRRWWVNTYPTQVADYYSAGPGPAEWLFRPEPVSGSPWRYRMTRTPGCRGFLTVMQDPSGGTRYEAIPDGY